MRLDNRVPSGVAVIVLDNRGDTWAASRKVDRDLDYRLVSNYGDTVTYFDRDQ